MKERTVPGFGRPTPGAPPVRAGRRLARSVTRLSSGPTGLAGRPSTARGPGRPVGRSPRTRVLALLVASVVAACGGPATPEPGAEPPAPPPSPYEAGIVALEQGDFRRAEENFRRLASRCESGEEGRASLVALVLVHLDLRNPEGKPQEAARLAAIHLNLPGAPEAERALMQTLYLNAVYQGADPVEGPADLEPPAPEPDSLAPPADTLGPAARPDSAAGAPIDSTVVAVADSTAVGPPALEPARRFQQCQLPDPAAWRGVPEYPGVPPSRWAEGDSVGVADSTEVGRTTALERRVRELEAELARIRKLLGGGGGPEPRS